MDRHYRPRGVLDVIYLDFAKAFDSVPHHRLIMKLQSYGIDGRVLSWIRSFLSTRRQRVVFGDAMSDWMPVISGIPQGSVLGPVLFVCFINDLLNGVSSFVHMYADDTKLGRCIVSIMDNHSPLTTDLDILIDWSVKWQLRFNASKCKILKIGSIRHSNTHSYTMEENGQSVILETTNEERDLGIWMDSGLKFDIHVSWAVSKANALNAVLGMIKRSFVYMDIPMFRQLYTALVRPHLEYDSVVWHPRFKKDIDMLENVQHSNKTSTCFEKFELRGTFEDSQSTFISVPKIAR